MVEGLESSVAIQTRSRLESWSDEDGSQSQDPVDRRVATRRNHPNASLSIDPLLQISRAVRLSHAGQASWNTNHLWAVVLSGYQHHHHCDRPRWYLVAAATRHLMRGTMMAAAKVGPVTCCLVLAILCCGVSNGFLVRICTTGETISFPHRQRKTVKFASSYSSNDAEWNSDSDDLAGDSFFDLSQVLRDKGASDLSACQSRQFSLGQDFILSSFVGTMGFDEVTDWEYYYQGEDDPNDRKVVQPNPLDSSKPKRTRVKSGSVLRLFRGEFVGTLGASLSAQGLDKRLLVKEFSGGKLAMQLAKSELESIRALQSALLISVEDAKEWVRHAVARSNQPRKDQANIARLVSLLSKAPFVGILGEANLAELEDMEPNEFYRALGVPPPKPDAIWLLYEYAGLSSLQLYAQPPVIRQARLPPKRGLFGNIVGPPPLPSFRERFIYVKAIMKKCIEAVANLHDNYIVHRSLGRSSFIISSTVMDKTQASSPYATSPHQLTVKLTDFGFSGPLQESTANEEFLGRARLFGLLFRKDGVASANYAIAEDLYALGVVFMGLLLGSLAELTRADEPMPSCDEDTLQRLFSDIFDKDMDQFRDYVEAEDVWSKLVEMLDDNNGAGWNLLKTLLLAREKVAEERDTQQILTIRTLLSSPFLTTVQ